MDTAVIIVIAVVVVVLILLFVARRRGQSRRDERRRVEAGDQYERASVAEAKAEDAERVVDRHRSTADEHADRARELDPDADDEESGRRRR